MATKKNIIDPNQFLIKPTKGGYVVRIPAKYNEQLLDIARQTRMTPNAIAHACIEYALPHIRLVEGKCYDITFVDDPGEV